MTDEFDFKFINLQNNEKAAHLFHFLFFSQHRLFYRSLKRVKLTIEKNKIFVALYMRCELFVKYSKFISAARLHIIMKVFRNAVSKFNHRHNKWQMNANLKKRDRNKNEKVIIITKSDRNNSESLSQ